jgi:hypothetical protein
MFVYVVLPGYLVNHPFDLDTGQISTKMAVLFLADFINKIVDDVSKNLVC